jgi:hypothetical protein
MALLPHYGRQLPQGKVESQASHRADDWRPGRASRTGERPDVGFVEAAGLRYPATVRAPDAEKMAGNRPFAPSWRFCAI